MAFAGLKKSADRDNLIAHLKEAVSAMLYSWPISPCNNVSQTA